jgi:surface protein
MVLSTVLRLQCWKYAPNHKYIRQIVFTDKPAPVGIKSHDVSEAQDGGVVRWKDGDTYYFSTQRHGVKVTAPSDCYKLFFECENLKTFDGSMLDTRNVVRMHEMFGVCKSLENINGLSEWNVSNVEDFGGMFHRCTSLYNLDGLKDWNVGHAVSMAYMFKRCKVLENVDALTDWDVGHVASMAHMFTSCTSIKNVDALSHWNVSNVRNMWWMFAWCTSLKNVDGLLDWSVSHVTDMDMMFWWCPNLSTKPSWYHDD